MGTDPLQDVQFRALSAAAEAASASNTRALLGRNVSDALKRHLALLSFELNWGSETEANRRDSGTQDEIVVTRSQTGVIRTSLRLPDGGTTLITAASSAEMVLSSSFLEVLGQIVAFGQRHIRIVERVAKLSSTAYQETQNLREQLRKFADSDTIVARSESMQRVLESADLVADHDTTVLLRGESGTGKELLARRIHRASRRARQPFVAVNCGALPETLIESELFGHERGSFTGATARYRGRFERASNGTIFLDEIAELPPSSQVKLLRILQEGEFERLGGEHTIRVNVRVIAATNRRLEGMLEARTFRTDLFYRLNVFPILIPPLRDRKEDIPVLAHALIADAAKRLGRPVPALGPDGIARLLAWEWPGNVRELANTIEREVIMSRGKELEFRDLSSPSAPTSEGRDRIETFDEGARRCIQNALEVCGGQIYGKEGAAARLGIPPSTLQGKMSRLGITRRT